MESDRDRRHVHELAALRSWLEAEVWPQVPDDQLDREPMGKAEREELLGLGPEEF